MIIQMIFQPCGPVFKHTVARLKHAVVPVKHVAAFLNGKYKIACFKPATARLKDAAGCSIECLKYHFELYLATSNIFVTSIGKV